MADQLGPGGVPGAPASANGLPEIAAAKALQWNVDLERGLRHPRSGAPCEAILRTGPRMLWWNEEPIPSVETAVLYKLGDGEDKTFANAMLQRLADSFRTGNNFTRLCILKAFLLVSKNAGRGRRRGHAGLFQKERIANHQEVLKRVKSVMDSGDVVARALALRMLGCLGEIAADSVDVHRLVIEALESPRSKEAEAALFATGSLCELSSQFAGVAFEKVVEMADAMGSSPLLKLSAIRVFSKFGASPHLARQAHGAGESLLQRMPTTDIVSAMLTSLTALALKSTATRERQVELLFAYLSSDPRASVRAVALQSLSKLASRTARSRVSRMWDFSVLFSVAEDNAAAPGLRGLAFEVLQKLSAHFVTVVDGTELYRLLWTVESNFLSYGWPLRQAALECLSSFGCNLKVTVASDFPKTQGSTPARGGIKDVPESESLGSKYNGNAESLLGSQSNRNFAARVGLLLCDQLALEGALALGDEKNISGDKIQEGFDPDRLRIITGLVSRLMQIRIEVASVILDSISGQIKVVTQLYLQGVRSLDGEAETVAPMDTDGLESTEPKVVSDQHGDVRTRLQAELEYVLTLCHCLYSGISQMDSTSACSMLPKLLDLTTEIAGDDSACHILRATLPPLLRMWRLSARRHFSDRESIENHITKCVDQMRKFGEVWTAYRVASEAATHGFWSPACSFFEDLVKKVRSEGCYVWLLGVSNFANAEAILSFSDKHVRSSGSEVPVGGMERPSTSNPDMAMDVDTGLMDNHMPDRSDRGGNHAFAFGEAAARAMPLLRQVGSVLAAGVCSERTFEFQRWFVSIRLRMVQSIVDLHRNLKLVLSSYNLPNTTMPAVDMNMDCPVPAFESPDDVASGGVDGMHNRQIECTFRCAKERASGISSQLVYLSKELDLLGLSFAGLDQESLECLLEAALCCSLLAFCTDAIFSVVSPATDNIKDHPTAQNLYGRLKHVKGFQGIDFLESWAGNENEVEGLLVDGCCPNGALISVCAWAIKIISKLERGNSVLKQQTNFQDVRVEALHFLQILIGGCVQLPFPIPRYFFCTRPRAAVDLFIAQIGGDEQSDLIVKQGSSLGLSICAQLSSHSVGRFPRISSLVCVLTYKGVESTTLVEEDLYADWKLGWHDDEAANRSLTDFSLITKLVQRARCEDDEDAADLEQDLVSTPSAKEDKHAPKGFKRRSGACGRSFAVFSIDRKGKGFSSCSLDVSTFPCGQYQLSFDCVGLDSRRRPWVLLPSRIRETLKITA